ncbi:threonine/serine exporter ThrE [Corynebacterium caspium]|uniref:threonine/serine exporter ThrE n=1 Tax=Corynebacterium caspium TaxID=234828 RepID=UPI00036D90DC|nr:threonine/serine exporter family protein [Corynebacterium caspium]WKD58723.1 hypothetical protein CCASP_01485 [Corynebacterium caspium DSM 44850]
MAPLWDRFRAWRRNPEYAATIDAVNVAPPPSPLAPVDLTDDEQVAAVMDIAARVGDILLSSGTSNQDTKTQIKAITSAYGLLWCHVDITLNNIILYATSSASRRRPLTVFRVVHGLGIDFSRLAAVDRLVRSIQAGDTPPLMAERILNNIETQRPPYRGRIALWGWGLLGGAVAMMLGGTWVVGAIAFFTCMLIMGVNIFLSRNGLPYFYQAVLGGFIATVPAAIAYSMAASAGWELKPSQITASGIVALLAGLTLVQSLQDGITGSPVTASAHFFETLLFTGAIVGGVGIGLQVAEALGITLPPMEASAPPNFASISVRVLFGAVATMGFAIACYAEKSGIIVAGATGIFGGSMYYLMVVQLGTGYVLGSAIAAVGIGFAGGMIARRFQVPPLITAVSGITPLLPGYSVYRAMNSLLNDQILIGFTNIATALAVACALAAGVVLGEWVARRLRRPHVFIPYRKLLINGRRASMSGALRQARMRALKNKGDIKPTDGVH